jgi:hypothetical protein
MTLAHMVYGGSTPSVGLPMTGPQHTTERFAPPRGTPRRAADTLGNDGDVPLTSRGGVIPAGLSTGDSRRIATTESQNASSIEPQRVDVGVVDTELAS